MKSIGKWLIGKSSNDERWDLDFPLAQLPTGDPWRLRDACEGTIILGGIGSGKTSGSGDALAIKFLDSNAGGLVLCVKTGEADYWKTLAKISGRENDIVVMTSNNDVRLNVFDYELKRSGRGSGLIINTVNLLRQVFDMVENSGGKAGMAAGADFWERAAKRMVTNAAQLQSLMDEPFTLMGLNEIIASAPRGSENEEDVGKPVLPDLKTKCGLSLANAFSKDPNNYDVLRAKDYFCRDFPTMGAKQRSGITETWEGIADPMLRTPIRQKFFEGHSTITPEDAIERGKIIIVDLPVKEFDLAGRIAGVIMKFIFQRAVERRLKTAKETEIRPFFIWVDEFQHFLTTYDMIFQQTSRSSKTLTVYIAQSIPTILASLGGENGKPWMNGLLGLLRTKIWHSNDCHVTNRWAADTIGQEYRQRSSFSAGHSAPVISPIISGSDNSNISISEHLEHILLPIEFQRLRTGGPQNNRLVDAYLFQGSRLLKNGTNFFKVTFKQRNT